jgi:adenylate kinase
VGVTGTPGSGKTKFAGDLAKRTGIKLVELNDLVEEHKLFSGIDETGAKIVKIEGLSFMVKERISEMRKKREKGVILVGHLIPDLDVRPDVTVVTRVALAELIKRLEARKYSKEKIKENLVSESIDYCGATAKERFGSTYEVETDSEKDGIIEYIRLLLEGEPPRAPKGDEINKMQEMLDLIYDGNKYCL